MEKLPKDKTEKTSDIEKSRELLDSVLDLAATPEHDKKDEALIEDRKSKLIDELGLEAYKRLLVGRESVYRLRLGSESETSKRVEAFVKEELDRLEKEEA